MNPIARTVTELYRPKSRGIRQTVEKLVNRDKYMAVSPPKPYCHTNKRQMYSSQPTQALLIVIQIRDKCMAVGTSFTVIQIRADKCMAVSPPKLYNKWLLI